MGLLCPPGKEVPRLHAVNKLAYLSDFRGIITRGAAWHQCIPGTEGRNSSWLGAVQHESDTSGDATQSLFAHGRGDLPDKKGSDMVAIIPETEARPWLKQIQTMRLRAQFDP